MTQGYVNKDKAGTAAAAVEATAEATASAAGTPIQSRRPRGPGRKRRGEV